MPQVPASRWITFLLIAVLGCALDLGTKSWIFAWLGPPGGETYWLLPEYFGLQTSLNQGALFGIGQGKVFIFASLSIAAALGIPIWLFWFRAALDAWLNTAMSFIMAGILGNLYDRLGLWWTDELARYPRYAVRDWILWQFQEWTWPNFNLADSFLVTGAIMIVIQAFLPPKLIDNGPPTTS